MPAATSKKPFISQLWQLESQTLQWQHEHGSTLKDDWQRIKGSYTICIQVNKSRLSMQESAAVMLSTITGSPQLPDMATRSKGPEESAALSMSITPAAPTAPQRMRHCCYRDRDRIQLAVPGKLWCQGRRRGSAPAACQTSNMWTPPAMQLQCTHCRAVLGM